jgi:predicted transcriptional regulator
MPITAPLVFSLHPWAAQAILAGTKTVELRRTAPHLTDGEQIVLYATSPVQRVVGRATVAGVDHGPAGELAVRHGDAALTGRRRAFDYLDGGGRPGAILIRSVEPCEPARLRGVPQSYRRLNLEQESDRAVLESPASKEGLEILAPHAPTIPEDDVSDPNDPIDPDDQLQPPYVIDVEGGFNPDVEPATWEPQDLTQAAPEERADLGRHMLYSFYRNVLELSAQMEAMAIIAGVPVEELNDLAIRAQIDDEEKSLRDVA